MSWSSKVFLRQRWLALWISIWLAAASAALAGHGGGEDAAKPAEGESTPAAEGGAAKGGEGEAKAKEGEGEKKDGESTPAKPSWKLGPSLNGKFDLNLLRSTWRLGHFRYSTDMIQMTLGEKEWKRLLMVRLGIEFGQESGMAEMDQNRTLIMDDIQRIIGRYDPRDLNGASGKWRLKEDLITQLNRRFKTARIRNLYIIDFRMLRV